MNKQTKSGNKSSPKISKKLKKQYPRAVDKYAKRVLKNVDKDALNLLSSIKHAANAEIARFVDAHDQLDGGFWYSLNSDLKRVFNRKFNADSFVKQNLEKILGEKLAPNIKLKDFLESPYGKLAIEKHREEVNAFIEKAVNALKRNVERNLSESIRPHVSFAELEDALGVPRSGVSLIDIQRLNSKAFWYDPAMRRKVVAAIEDPKDKVKVLKMTEKEFYNSKFVDNPKVIKALGNKISENKRIIENISKYGYEDADFKDAFRRIDLTHALKENQNRLIKQTFKDTTKKFLESRELQLISLNSAMKLSSETTKNVALSVGAQLYVWLTMHDPLVREDHEKLEGIMCDYRNPPKYPSGLGYLGCNPGEDYNCRCVAIHIPYYSPLNDKRLIGKEIPLELLDDIELAKEFVEHTLGG